MMHTDKYKHEKLTEKIIGCAFDVQNNLGCGFLEKVYERALLHELQMIGLKAEPQKAMKIVYKGKEVGNYIADIVIENKVIVELKTVEFLTKIHKAQALNYLKAAGFEVGLILNFARPKLEYKRVVV